MVRDKKYPLFASNLRWLRDEAGLTQLELCEKAGFSRSSLTGWEGGISRPSPEDEKAIVDFFNISWEELHWIDLEKRKKENAGTPEIRESKRKEVIALGKHAPLRLKPEEYAEAFGDWPGLPIYNEPITASFVASYRDTNVHVPQYYLHDPRFRDCDFGAVVTGDSMHPEIRHGDIVACKLLNDSTFIVFGDIYYIVASNGLETCKYIQRVKQLRDGAKKRGRGGSKSRYDETDIIYDEDKVLLVPYNTAIDPSPILKSMIERLYKVRGIIRGY